MDTLSCDLSHESRLCSSNLICVCFRFLSAWAVGKKTAGTVHDYAIKVLVQRQDFEKRIMEYLIVFRNRHGCGSQKAKITRMDQHEPAREKRLYATMTGRFACVLI